MTRKLRSSFS